MIQRFFSLLLLGALTAISAYADDKGVTIYLTDGTHKQYRVSDIDSIVYDEYYEEVEPQYLNGHEYVDLGLSVKWAACNVGADSAYQTGYYMAWADTVGYVDYMVDEHAFSYSTYKYCNGMSNTLTKYCSNAYYGYEGYTDELTSLLPDDDAALRYMGEGWQTPTRKQMLELKNNCYWCYTDNYRNTSVPGYVIYKVKNDNDRGIYPGSGKEPTAKYSLRNVHIFLPLAGYRRAEGGQNTTNFDADGVWARGKSGLYLTADIDTGSPESAYILNLKSNTLGVNSTGAYRYYGCTVRAVCSPEVTE